MDGLLVCLPAGGLNAPAAGKWWHHGPLLHPVTHNNLNRRGPVIPAPSAKPAKVQLMAPPALLSMITIGRKASRPVRPVSSMTSCAPSKVTAPLVTVTRLALAPSAPVSRPTQVELRVPFDAGFGRAELGPRKKRQGQIDGCRTDQREMAGPQDSPAGRGAAGPIECTDRLVQSQPEVLAGMKSPRRFDRSRRQILPQPGGCNGRRNPSAVRPGFCGVLTTFPVILYNNCRACSMRITTTSRCFSATVRQNQKVGRGATLDSGLPGRGVPDWS